MVKKNIVMKPAYPAVDQRSGKIVQAYESSLDLGDMRKG